MSSNSIKYSVCICNYNMADTLEISLSSVLNQLDDRFEVLIIDDGSKDKSVDIIKMLKIKYNNLRLICLKRDKNRKLGETRNISIKEARGEYVILHIDSDDYWEPYIVSFVNLFHKLEKLLKKNVLLSGQQINIAKKDFLLQYGPYRNIQRSQDRDMWHRLASIDAYIPVDHMVFRKRLTRPYLIQLKRNFINTWNQILYELMQSRNELGYLISCFTSLFKYQKSIAIRQKVIRAIFILPVFIKCQFLEPWPMPKPMPTHEDFLKYKENVRGTFIELFKRYGSSYDLSDMSIQEQIIFNNKV